jgi:hypothetical protein
VGVQMGAALVLPSSYGLAIPALALPCRNQEGVQPDVRVYCRGNEGALRGAYFGAAGRGAGASVVSTC